MRNAGSGSTFRKRNGLGLVYAIVWAAAGLAMAVIGIAVSPPDEVPALPLTAALGILGGFGGGLVIELLARPTVPGFTAGFIGSVTGSSVLLIALALARPAHRAA